MLGETTSGLNFRYETLCFSVVCWSVGQERFFVSFWSWRYVFAEECWSLVFLLNGGVVFHSFSFSLFSLFLALSLFFCAISFSVFLVRTRFQPNSSDIGLARLPIKPLTGTDSVDGTFFDFSALTCFQSDRADIGLPRPPIGVLTSTNVPCRHIHPKCAVLVRQFLGCCFHAFLE